MSFNVSVRCFKMAKKFVIIWATFVRNFVTKKFKKIAHSGHTARNIQKGP